MKSLLLFFVFVASFGFYDAAQAQCFANFTTGQDGDTIFVTQYSSAFTDATWNFGDGTVINSTQTIVSHVYNAPGTYTVCLHVTNSNLGCSDDTCIDVKICNYISSFTSIVNGNSAAFTNTSTGNPADLYIWEFGDFTTELNFNTVHSYATTGLFNVCLSLTDSGSQCTVTYCNDVLVSGGGACFNESQIDTNVLCSQIFDPVCGCDGVTYYNPCQAYYYGGVTSYTFGACPQPCTASFNSNVTGNSVLFQNTTTDSFTNVLWNFGDGTTSTDTLPIHVFSGPGTYNVCLTISGGGCTNTHCSQVVIAPSPCQVAFDIQSACNAVTFVNTSTGGYTNWVWNVNGITSVNDSSLTFVFGNDTVIHTILIATGGGCPQGSHTDSIQIHTPNELQAYFHDTYTHGYLPVTVNFNGFDSLGIGTTYHWDFNDSTAVGTTQNLTHTFTKNCNPLVCLTVTDNIGCQSTYCDSLHLCFGAGVNDIPQPIAFALYPNPGTMYCMLQLKQPLSHARLQVTDVLGRVVMETAVNAHANQPLLVNTSQLPTGCYAFNVITPQGRAMVRWVKEK